MTIEYIIIGAAVLLLVSVLASKASTALGIPALLLFLMIGMLAGSEGPGGIPFNDATLAQSLGVVALVYILFAGGVSTEWERVRSVTGYALALATLGVLLTAFLMGLFAVYVLGLSTVEGLLLGSIVSSTDAAAVFAILRSRNVHLRERLKSLLEFESGSNDPMAVFLTVSMIHLLTDPSAPVLGLVPSFAQQMTAGAALGYLAGRGMVFVINRVNLEYDGLYPVLSLTMTLLTYGITAVLGGNGFLAVYVAGLVLGNSTFIHKHSLIQFHDGVAWLMQIAMFLTLGLLVYPSHLIPVAKSSLAASLFLMFVARPLSVFLTLAPTRLPLPEKIMAAWVGLRGAVPVILATYPLLAGVPRAETIFNVVFFVVFTSVLLQGPSLPWVARRLKVDVPEQPAPRPAPTLLSPGSLSASLTEIPVPPDSPLVGKPVVELGLPRGAYIVLVQRGDDILLPSGATVIAPDDVLLMAGDPDSLEAVRLLVQPGAVA
ncbi:MAG: potassium/proton antiporter [Armatimonadetes bacterium]|nr:potassium/proton antiporter [Armatimonadota bacterium]